MSYNSNKPQNNIELNRFISFLRTGVWLYCVQFFLLLFVHLTHGRDQEMDAEKKSEEPPKPEGLDVVGMIGIVN